MLANRILPRESLQTTHNPSNYFGGALDSNVWDLDAASLQTDYTEESFKEADCAVSTFD